MPVSCESNSLLTGAACFGCLDSEQSIAVQTYLLAVLAGGSLDPQALLEQAVLYLDLTPDQRQSIQVSLLCQIVNLP